MSPLSSSPVALSFVPVASSLACLVKALEDTGKTKDAFGDLYDDLRAALRELRGRVAHDSLAQMIYGLVVRGVDGGTTFLENGGVLTLRLDLLCTAFEILSPAYNDRNFDSRVLALRKNRADLGISWVEEMVLLAGAVGHGALKQAMGPGFTANKSGLDELINRVISKKSRARQQDSGRDHIIERLEQNLQSRPARNNNWGGAPPAKMSRPLDGYGYPAQDAPGSSRRPSGDRAINDPQRVSPRPTPALGHIHIADIPSPAYQPLSPHENDSNMNGEPMTEDPIDAEAEDLARRTAAGLCVPATAQQVATLDNEAETERCRERMSFLCGIASVESANEPIDETNDEY